MTRCCVGFYNYNEEDLSNYEILLYKHYDGNPDSILADFSNFLVRFDEIVGIADIYHASANLLVYWKLQEFYWDKEYLNKLNLPSSFSFFGIRILKEIPKDISYYYAVYSDGRILVYSTPFDFKNPSEWKLIKETSISEL